MRPERRTEPRRRPPEDFAVVDQRLEPPVSATFSARQIARLVAARHRADRGTGAAVHRRHPAQQRFRIAGQRDERAYPHRLHRHHRGWHVLRDHLRRHRPVGRFDGGADRGTDHPADEHAGRVDGSAGSGGRDRHGLFGRAGGGVRADPRAADHARPDRTLHRHSRHARHLPGLPDILLQRGSHHPRRCAVRRLQPRLLHKSGRYPDPGLGVPAGGDSGRR